MNASVSVFFRALPISFSLTYNSAFIFLFFFSICIFLLLPEWLLCWRDGFAPNAYRVNVQWTTGEFMKAKWTKIIQYMTTKKNCWWSKKKCICAQCWAHLLQNILFFLFRCNFILNVKLSSLLHFQVVHHYSLRLKFRISIEISSHTTNKQSNNEQQKNV